MKLVASFGYRYGPPKRQYNKGLLQPVAIDLSEQLRRVKDWQLPYVLIPTNEYDFAEIHDVRVLYGKKVDNPYHDPYLATLNGLHPDVQAAVYAKAGVLRFIEEACLRNPETVAIGCTAGRHRSVAIAEEIGRRTGAKIWHMNQKNWPV